MSIHVTHVITKLDVGGAQTHVVELALGQLAAGYEVDVIAGLAGPAATRLAAAGVPVRLVPALGSSRGRFSQRAAVGGVLDALRAVGPDIVHGHSSNGGLAARLAARRLGLPSVYTAHGWPFQRGAAWSQRLASFAGEFVAGHIGGAVICLTEAERARALRARVVPAKRIWVIPNGLADVSSELRRAHTLGGRPPVLVMVARFAPPKLQGELLGVLAEIADVPWTMRFIGDGPQLADCRAALAGSPALQGRVDLLGHRDDVAELLASSDVGLLWSRYEGLPISVLEMMRAGICCVASDLPGTRTLFGTPPAGVVAASDEALALELRALLASPDRIDALGDAARARYEEHYSITALVESTGEVYAAVRARRG